MLKQTVIFEEATVLVSILSLPDFIPTFPEFLR
jgi:hypothetical protein